MRVRRNDFSKDLDNLFDSKQANTLYFSVVVFTDGFKKVIINNLIFLKRMLLWYKFSQRKQEIPFVLVNVCALNLQQDEIYQAKSFLLIGDEYMVVDLNKAEQNFRRFYFELIIEFTVI